MCYIIFFIEKVGVLVEIVFRYFWVKVGLIFIIGNVVFFEDMVN